ncbi:MAG: PIN domain-containing protein [Pseudorhodoferax sp.]
MICFFDTNVLVYTVDASAGRHRQIAQECFAETLREHEVVLSTQVLQEFFNVTTRKLRPPLSVREATEQMRQLARLQVLGTSAQSVLDAIALAEQHQLSWWDALILEAALRAGAERLYSEDGQHGRRFGSLEIVNPFLA